jgi:Flp pilus assembly protein TadD
MKIARQAPAVRPRAGRRRVLFALAAALLLGTTWFVWKMPASSRSAPARAADVPDPPTADMEPPVREIIARARQGVLKTPGSAEAWGWYAAVLDAHSIYKPAELCYRRAIELAPQDPRYAYNLGILLESLGAEPDESLVLMRRLAAQQPTFPPVHVRIGMTLMRKGDYRAAAESFRRALALDPKFTMARRSLGQTLLALDDAAGALPELQRAAREVPQDRPTRAALAQAYTLLGDDARATETLRGVNELGPAMPFPDPVRFLVEQQGSSAKQAAARAASRQLEGDWAGAAQDLEIVKRTRASDPSVYERLAEAYQHLGRLDLAEAHRAQARTLRGGN